MRARLRQWSLLATFLLLSFSVNAQGGRAEVSDVDRLPEDVLIDIDGPEWDGPVSDHFEGANEEWPKRAQESPLQGSPNEVFEVPEDISPTKALTYMTRYMAFRFGSQLVADDAFDRTLFFRAMHAATQTAAKVSKLPAPLDVTEAVVSSLMHHLTTVLKADDPVESMLRDFIISIGHPPLDTHDEDSLEKNFDAFRTAAEADLAAHDQWLTLEGLRSVETAMQEVEDAFDRRTPAAVTGMFNAIENEVEALHDLMTVEHAAMTALEWMVKYWKSQKVKGQDFDTALKGLDPKGEHADDLLQESPEAQEARTDQFSRMVAFIEDIQEELESPRSVDRIQYVIQLVDNLAESRDLRPSTTVNKKLEVAAHYLSMKGTNDEPAPALANNVETYLRNVISIRRAYSLWMTWKLLSNGVPVIPETIETSMVISDKIIQRAAKVLEEKPKFLASSPSDWPDDDLWGRFSDTPSEDEGAFLRALEARIEEAQTTPEPTDTERAETETGQPVSDANQDRRTQLRRRETFRSDPVDRGNGHTVWQNYDRGGSEWAEHDGDGSSGRGRGNSRRGGNSREDSPHSRVRYFGRNGYRN